MLKEYKKKLRQVLIEKRESIDLNLKRALDKKIFFNITNSDEYKKSTDIFVFVSFGSEINTHSIITHALENNKKIYIPKIISVREGMEAVKINSLEELTENKYGILETKDSSNITDPHILDYILVPGLGFDLKGRRIGYGGGFYDRFLSRINSITEVVGLAYENQILDNLEVDQYDLPVKEIVTEKSIYRINPSFDKA